MLTSLHFNPFGNALHRKQANQRGIPDPLCDNIMSRSHYVLKNSNLDDVEIEDLPLYAITLSFHDKIGSIKENKDSEDSDISNTGTLFLFSVRGI